MNTFLSRSLATKLVVVVGPLLALVVMAITWLAVTTASRSQKQSEARGLVQLTAAQAAKINSTNVDNLAVARQTSHGFGTLPKDDRGFVDGYLKGVFLDHRTSAGVYAQFEPNAFGGPGTYAPWWGLTDGKLTYVGQSVDIRHADWYQVPKVTRRPSVIEPYVDPKIHVLMTSYTAPVFTGGRFRGVTGIDVALADVQRDVARLKVLQTGKAFLVTPKGTFLAAPRKSLVGKPAWPSLRDSKLASLRTAIRRARSSQTTAANPFGGGDAIITSSPVAVGGWSLVTIAPVSEALAPVTRLRNRLLIVGLLALLLTGAALLVTATRLLAPLRGFVTRLRTISERDVPAVASGLEAIARGDLSQTVQATAEPVPSRGLDEVATASDALNAVVESTRASADAYEQSRASLAEVIGQVAAASKVVSHSSQEVASSAAQANHVIDDIAGSISQVAESAGRQAAMVGSAQERAELVNRAIQVSAQGAQETAEAAQRAQQAATEGAARIDEATAAMAEARASSEDVSSVIESLAERSGRIGDIVRTITTITEQTNLLALNAAIEAARAGEQGRGFAVVADQVRDLAEESQRAAESISTLVDEIQAETQRTVTSVADDVTRTKRTAEIVTAARDAFESIADAVGDVTDRVHDIAETAAQVATQTAQVQEDMEEVAKLSDQSSAAAEQVSASAEESSATTHEIAEAAVALARSAETLDGLVGRFSS